MSSGRVWAAASVTAPRMPAQTRIVAFAPAERLGEEVVDVGEPAPQGGGSARATPAAAGDATELFYALLCAANLPGIGASRYRRPLRRSCNAGECRPQPPRRAARRAPGGRAAARRRRRGRATTTTAATVHGRSRARRRLPRRRFRRCRELQAHHEEDRRPPGSARPCASSAVGEAVLRREIAGRAAGR